MQILGSECSFSDSEIPAAVRQRLWIDRLELLQRPAWELLVAKLQRAHLARIHLRTVYAYDVRGRPNEHHLKIKGLTPGEPPDYE